MGKMSDLDYNIQELFIEGLEIHDIAQELEVPLDWVSKTLESFGAMPADLDSYATIQQLTEKYL
jgi:hypothetical protein